MATGSTPLRRVRYQSSSGRRALAAVLLAVALVVVALAVAAVAFSGVTLAPDATALASVQVQAFGGSLASARAYGPGGSSIPLSTEHGLLTPRVKLTPGERVTVDVVVRRPGWDGWLVGSESHQQLVLQAPVADVTGKWLSVPRGANPRASFGQPVSAVVYTGASGGLVRRSLADHANSVSLGARPPAGSARIAAAARPWERLGPSMRLVWFPATGAPIALASPAPGSRITPDTTIQLTFSRPVSQVLGNSRPRLEPYVSGAWHRVGAHTLVFKPSGYGAPLGATVNVFLPRKLAVAGPSGNGMRTATQISWSVPDGSMLRLEQLLAQQGYLPLTWSGAAVPLTPAAQVKAAVEPPAGSFHWRYPNTPSQLQGLWSEGQANGIVRGAVMKFENDSGLTADGEAGTDVWRALINDAIAGKQLGGGTEGGYTYVYVREESPEMLTLWHDGRTVLTSAANTGIPGAETELGTFPVFEHIPEGTMEGTNPDGSHYHDEGIKWISYFNGGDAVHYFERASFGVPQSLGCVELPLEDAAAVYPYMPLGTLVTIEG